MSDLRNNGVITIRRLLPYGGVRDDKYSLESYEQMKGRRAEPEVESSTNPKLLLTLKGRAP